MSARAAVAVAVVAMLVGAAAQAGVGGSGPGGCVAELRSHPVWDREQLGHAATIAEVAVEMDMRPLRRAVTVALATAMQESTLHNYGHRGERNDHDSLGLFQQRPSMGWGTAEQVQRPRYAAREFFRHLRQVPGWAGMRVTDAAQRVQNSAYPEAYQQWARKAKRLARRLLRNCRG